MSRLGLRWGGELDWWLDGTYGSVKFDSERAVDSFARAMSEGTDALKAHLLSDTLIVTGTSTSFLAEDRGTEDIIGCLVQAGDWLTKVAHPEGVASYVKANSRRVAKPIDKRGPPPPPEHWRSSHDTLKSIVDEERMIIVDADPKLHEAAIEALKQHRAKTTDASIPRDIDATYILTWWNQTAGEHLTLCDAQVHPSWILSVKAMPDKHFRTGSTTLAWFFTNGAWAQGDMDGYCIWYAPNGSWFGVNIHCPVQIFGIGTAPYYEVAWSEWGKETFFKPVDEPFISFDFPRSLGYDIQIEPQSGHSAIIVDVIINKIT
ncbi:hypothetical protein LB506_005080 [Fusarium annulatum]|nr:hypothetical protein LB506_005080 [Fusarium annulatum]